MKKYVISLLVFIGVLFININRVDAAINTDGGGNTESCTNGIVCRYSFCGMRDSSQTANGQIAQSCPERTNQVFLDIVYRCADPDKNISSCNSFVSWAYQFKNTDGKSCVEPEWGNYDYIFNNADSYLKKTFKNRGSFSCPEITVSLDSSNNNKYNYGYVKNKDYDSTNPDSANAWKNMPSGRRVRGSVVSCINSSTNLDEIRTKANESCAGTVQEAVEEEIEKSEEILGLDDPDKIVSDCEKNPNTIICSIYAWGMDLSGGGTRYSSEAEDPCDLINGEIRDILHEIFFFISVAGIIVLVVMTAISLVKVITASEDEALRNFLKGLWKRIICLIILLMLPMIVTFIIQLVNNVAPNLGIRSDNPLCNVTK